MFVTKEVLDGIKRSILPTSSLFYNGDTVDIVDDVAYMINCYAYAIGSMYVGDVRARGVAYEPGFTENIGHQWRTDTARKVMMDLGNLGISARQLSLEEPIETATREGEYLVKLYLKTGPREDFHFVRRDPITGIWFHKIGTLNQPMRCSLMPENPKQNLTVWWCQSNQYVEYAPVCYFTITEPHTADE